jgi:DNA-nicking Smr family endonuclease
MSDDEDFRRLLGGDVKPLEQEKRVRLARSDADAPGVEERRRAAAEERALAEDPLSSGPVELVDPLALLSFKRPGVQNGVFRNLRLGKYPLDARLDLHRMTVEAARQMLYRFVQDCLANDVRTALITHGKGEGRDSPAMLKSCVAHWLPQMPDVLAFHTAQKQHGSYGATYVLLRKSDKKKQETRERVSKRGA